MVNGQLHMLMHKTINMERLKAYYDLLKAPNYIFGALILIKISLFESTNAATTLDISSYFLLVFSLLFIASGGYLINDIHSIQPDKINFPNKPLVQERISVKQATNIYILFTSIGIILGMYVCYSIGYTSYGMLFIALAAIPYLYATSLKNTGALGNFILATLGFMVFCIPAILDLMPAITEANQLHQASIFKTLLLYAGFGFAFTYINSIIANLRTLPGDRKIRVRTMAYQLGFDTTKKIALISSVIIFIVLLYSIYNFVDNGKLLAYFVFAVVAPFIYFIIQLIYLKKEKMLNQLNILQNILKIVYTTGIISIILLYYF